MKEVPKFVRGLLRRQDLSGPQQAVSAQIQKAVFIPTYPASDIYDEEELGKEVERSVQEFAEMQKGLPALPIQVGSPKEVKDWRSWQENQSKAWRVFRYLSSLEQPYAAQIASFRAGGEPLTLEQFCRYQVLYMGGNLLLRNIFQQELLYATRQGFADTFRPHIDKQEFNFYASKIHIQIGGVSLADVIDTDQQRDGSASQYRFLVDSVLVRHRGSHNTVFQANLKGPYRRYPNMTKHAIDSLTAEVQAALSCSPEIVDSEIRSNSGIAREVAEWGKRYVQRIETIREGVYWNILNPDSAEFPALQEALMFYLKQRGIERVVALYVAGLDKEGPVYQMYRIAKSLEERGIQTSFYRALMDAILEYTRTMFKGVILQQGDTLSILDPEQNLNQTPPTIEAFGRTISSIFSKSSQRVYEIDPSSIGSAGISQPQAIIVIFDQNRPQRFRVLLNWENDWESTELSLYFDTKRNKFDWNFLESPASPEMKAMYRASFAVTQIALVSIHADVSRKYQQKQQRENALVASPTTKAKQNREHIIDEVYTMRRQARQGSKENITPVTIQLSEVIESLSVPRRVIIPEVEELQKMLGNIHSGERDDVLRALDRFNKEGVGEFSRKRAKGQNGKALYTLRVGNTRVLVYEIESSEEVRNFRIIDIDDRSRIYRKNKI